MKKTILSISVAISCAYASEGLLLQEAKQNFGPLPKTFPSETNTLTQAKIKLGKMLFHEKRVSIDGTTSCAKCHPFSYYGADNLEKSRGNFGKLNPRNAPTVLNAAGQISQHWRGDRKDVEEQARKALLGKGSFGAPSNEWVEKKLQSIEQYTVLFKKAFPNDAKPISVANYAKAIGAWERMLSTPSRFDEFLEGRSNALTQEEKAGLKTFIKTGCASCHSGALLGGTMNQKFGMVAPYWEYTKSKKIDEGRYNVTKKEGDKYVFKVPQLRNIAMTSPYFHDGSVTSLKEAVKIMAKVQLGVDLSQEETQSIYLFLESLTGKLSQDIVTVPLLPETN
ncbi:c-type cytochrome [Sulfurimonas sediminis]|uniref:C-type cytochrome n=1 Tax=Sulfurimonas sediminis TaxID=2590020 RepID=A0A7M1B4D9_9BACT|nr:cytochrome c peroxidase [Sulfurimonas sediminis]QOP44530.1 c-type cytochrome [Sulfurimonas sediminis]